MGYSLDLFVDEDSINPEFLCSICHDVLRAPIMTQNCEHVFCSSCINEWKATSNTCPVDRAPILGTRVPFRPFMNLYNSLQVKCSADGCTHQSTLGQIHAHFKSCVHNPNGIQPCAQGCGGQIKMKDIPSHSCLEYLKAEVDKKNKEIAALQEQVRTQAQKIREMDPRNRADDSDSSYDGVDGFFDYDYYD